MKLKDLEPGSYFIFANNVQNDLKNGLGYFFVFKLIHGGIFEETSLGILSPANGGVARLSSEQLASEVILLKGI